MNRRPRAGAGPMCAARCGLCGPVGALQGGCGRAWPRGPQGALVGAYMIMHELD